MWRPLVWFLVVLTDSHLTDLSVSFLSLPLWPFPLQFWCSIDLASRSSIYKKTSPSCYISLASRSTSGFGSAGQRFAQLLRTVFSASVAPSSHRISLLAPVVRLSPSCLCVLCLSPCRRNWCWHFTPPPLRRVSTYGSVVWRTRPFTSAYAHTHTLTPLSET